MSRYAYFAGAALALAATACARQEPAGNVTADTTTTNLADNGLAGNNMMTPATLTLSNDEKSFLDEAIRGDIGEAKIGQLAREKGQSQAAKDLGAMLATDHSAHLATVTSLAQQAGMTVPTEPTDEAKTNYDKLNSLTGADFDAALKTMMIEDHQKDIAKYEKQAAGTGPLASMASETVPTLKKHLEQAQKI